MQTLLDIVKKTTDFLSSKGVESPRLTAELLIGHALGLKRMQLYVQFEKLLAESDLEKIRPLVRRRAQREPLQYIVGEVDWGGLKLKVDRRALIPRPETEYLLELIGKSDRPAPQRILDLGTGSGALALGLAKQYPDAKVVAVEKSPDALALARENLAAQAFSERVELRQSDWFSNLAGETPFDLIVANPPYLSPDEAAEAPLEVRSFEPHSALASSENGLADLRKIIAQALPFLSASGYLALETGIAQHPALEKLCQEAGFSRVESKKDLTGRDRFVFAWR